MTAAPSQPPLLSSLSVAVAPEAPRILPTLNDDGSRRWIRPRPSRGRFLTARRIVAYLLIAVFTLIPYLRVRGKPLVLLDLGARRFTILGTTFLPTDTLLLALLLVGIFLTIFLLTALFGRVWCGWACPQTVYMEFLFRPIERLLTGTPGRVSRSWIVRSGFGKVLKPGVYLLVSAYLAHTFLAYFVGVDQLRIWVTRSPLEHPTSFLVMLAVTALMLFDFGYFREQVCLVACPYGRLQSALLDRQSMIVGYDRARGEPRGKAAKARAAADKAASLAESAAAGNIRLPIISSYQTRTGDCVDCGLCVATCPTGIDIRDGLQMECIGCAQCIDACDAVMAKLNRPAGLIRYSSQARLAGERPRLLRVRTVLYPLILAVIAGAFLIALLSRQPADITLLRGLGRPYTQLADGSVENPVRIKIINRTDAPQSFTLSAADAHAHARLAAEENPVTVAPGQSRTVPALILAPPGAFATGSFEAQVIVDNGRGFSVKMPTRVQGPATRPARTQPAAPEPRP